MRASTRDPAFLGALSFFDAAARNGSFQGAAEEMGVTPSAVSHRIAALERALGQKLFRRETRRVHLTREGAEFAESVRRVLSDIDTESERLRRVQVLRVSVGPFISANWLMSRLGAFERAMPGTRVDLVHAIGAAPARDVDVAILWEKAVRSERYFGVLFDTQTIPVASPDLGCGPNFWEQDVTPIHYRDRTAWRRWLAGVGGGTEFARRGEVVNDPNLVIEAAIHGRGVALGFFPFIAEPLASGRLRAVNDTVVPADWAYVIDLADSNHALSRAFAAWLLEQAAVTEAAR